LTYKYFISSLILILCMFEGGGGIWDFYFGVGGELFSKPFFG